MIKRYKDSRAHQYVLKRIAQVERIPGGKYVLIGAAIVTPGGFLYLGPKGGAVVKNYFEKRKKKKENYEASRENQEPGDLEIIAEDSLDSTTEDNS